MDYLHRISPHPANGTTDETNQNPGEFVSVREFFHFDLFGIKLLRDDVGDLK
jgi:hypothetical protein